MTPEPTDPPPTSLVLAILTKNFGRDWTEKVEFVENPESSDKKFVYFAEETLVSQMSAFLRLDDKIRHVWVYKCPLAHLGAMYKTFGNYLFHTFVLLKFDSGWLSVEKNQIAVTIQKGSTPESLLERFRHEPRSQPVEKVTSGHSNATIGELLNLLIDQHFLSEPYSLMSENCKLFAGRIYEKLNSEDKECKVGKFQELHHPTSNRQVFVDDSEDLTEIDGSAIAGGVLKNMKKREEIDDIVRIATDIFKKKVGTEVAEKLFDKFFVSQPKNRLDEAAQVLAETLSGNMKQ
jgi:hypothetical protein